LFFIDKNIRPGHESQIWQPGRLRVERAAASAAIRAFKPELGIRTAAAKPLGARE
jgi:hypothetical protein